MSIERISGTLPRLRDGVGHGFGVFTPGWFRSPQGTVWLALVHEMAWGAGMPDAGMLTFRCMRTGRLVHLPMDGSWRARPAGWDEVERALGIRDPYARRGERIWEPSQDHLVFSVVARGVYELAEARDLPGASELDYVARGQDYRRRRDAVSGDGHGGATCGWSALAEGVLDRVLPPLGVEYLGSLAGRRPRRLGEAKAAREALRLAVQQRARQPFYVKGLPREPTLSPSQVWTRSGWKDAASELTCFIERAARHFAGRARGERDGQTVLFNPLVLDELAEGTRAGVGATAARGRSAAGLGQRFR